MDIFLGSSQNSTILGVISMHFRVLSLDLGIFCGCKNFKYFFGVLEIPYIFGGEG